MCIITASSIYTRLSLLIEKKKKKKMAREEVTEEEEEEQRDNVGAPSWFEVTKPDRGTFGHEQFHRQFAYPNGYAHFTPPVSSPSYEEKGMFHSNTL